MNTTFKMVLISIGFASLIAGCTAPSDGGSTTGGETEQSVTLEVTSPCTAETCGSLPLTGCAEGQTEAPSCNPDAAGACAWSLGCTAPGSHDAVSYEQCPAADCGAEPDASVCPDGTTFEGSQCGSTNDEACVWTTACAMPPSTEPCGDNECGPQPSIAVICEDGSTGDLACMSSGSECAWQRTCE